MTSITRVQEETADVLARLIRFNTVNPPGNERECQEWIAGYLREAGLDVELLGTEAARPNLVARLQGDEPGPVLGYLSHVDTVLADPGDWSHDPWSGDVADGHLWGRGAIDMKSQTAAEIVAAATLARSGWRPAKGELKIISVVDEEVGGRLGAQWLTEQRPDVARVDWLVNEGGGAVMPYGDRRLFGVCCAEKGTFRFTVRARGRAVHASVPGVGDNALLKLAPVIERLGRHQPDFDVVDEPRALLVALGEDPADPAAAVASIRATEPRLAVMVEPTLRVTAVPTRIFASEFGKALGAADEVIVMDVYAAREDPEPGVTGALVASSVPLPPESVTFEPSWSAVPEVTAARLRPGDVVFTFGAGDVTLIGPEILELLDREPAGHHA